jgi:dipeptidyl aminopeptidase/acylaminoacyl peptidase
MFNVKNVNTPTLIQHGEIDERVPLEQGLQLYIALKRQEVPVEMFIYPRQHHSIAEPRLRIDMRRRPIAWFKKWLLEEPAKID